MEVKDSRIFVERDKTFRYVYDVIRKCVFHMYVTTAVDNGRSVPKLLRRGSTARHREGRKTSGFQGIQCGMFIKL